MNTKQLLCFVKVYELKNLTKAAKLLGVTQSNVSKSIQNLEKELDLVLFYRHTRDVVPTEASVELYKHACRCLSSLSDFEQKARHISKGSNPSISIGCGPLAHDLLLKPLINHLLLRKSSIRIHYNTGTFSELKQGLDNHNYDCLFYDVGELEFMSDPTDYQVESLLQEPIHVVANHDHPIHRSESSFQQVFAHHWVLPPVPKRYLKNLPDEFKNFLLDPHQPYYEVTNLTQALELAEQNNLITIAVGDLSSPDFLRRSLKPIKIPFSINSDIGFWCVRSRFMSKPLNDIFKTIKLICQK